MARATATATTNEISLGRPRRDPRASATCAALLATLFLSRGTTMLTAGDEFGRTQHGNNNAYAQDNETTWLDWNKADQLADRLRGRASRNCASRIRL